MSDEDSAIERMEKMKNEKNDVTLPGLFLGGVFIVHQIFLVSRLWVEYNKNAWSSGCLS